MKKYRKIIVYALALCLANISCKDDADEWGLAADGVLRLAAQKEKAVSRAEGSEESFDLGTVYRIWAYQSGSVAETDASFPADGVDGKEDELAGGRHYIRLDEAYNDKLAGAKDFYGFTVGGKEARACQPDAGNVAYNIATAGNGYGYPDYMRAKLPSDEQQGNLLTLKFKHIMSQVTFKVVQQSETEVAEGNRLEVKSISLKKADGGGIPATGTYNVLSNQFTVNTRDARTISASNEAGFEVPVATPGDDEVAAEFGNPFLIFPSRAEMTESKTVPQYVATVVYTDPSGKYGEANKELTAEIPVYDSWSGAADTPLEFQSNYHYTLVIIFLNDKDKRVITLVPQVFDWLDGETDKTGDDGKGYEEQDLGQPVTFNGVLWSDRNLGATSANPTRSYNDWLKSVGYFYQYGRNIPYFPMASAPTKEGYISRQTDLGDPKVLRLSLVTEGYKEGKNPLYPVVDPSSWGIDKIDEYFYKLPDSSQIDGNKWIWQLGEPGEPKTYFSYCTLDDYSVETVDKPEGFSGLLGKPGDKWKNNEETPCPPGWRLPTKEDFLGILPGSAYSGNITFRKYTRLNDGGSYEAEVDDSKIKEPDFQNVFSKENIGDIKVITRIGQTNEEASEVAYQGAFPYIFREEDEFGGKSQYMLSMDKEDWVRVRDGSGDLIQGHDFNWGVIYGIKRQGTNEAYRIKWEVLLVSEDEEPEIDASSETDAIPPTKVYREPFRGVLVISRYKTDINDRFYPDENGSYGWIKEKYDWKEAAEVLYLPVGGIANHWSKGKVTNIGTETWYAVSGEDITEGSGAVAQRKTIFWFKFAGTETTSQSLILSNLSPLGDAVQIRCVRDLNSK